jgi:hypothetical protein
VAYASLDELKTRMGVPLADSTMDDEMTDALDAASEEIDDHCGRTFLAEVAASARKFQAYTPRIAVIDDIWTTDDLVVAVDGATTTDFELRPLNGVQYGRSGWPYDEIRFGEDVLTTGVVFAPLEITAQWGWAAVPENVHVACLILAAETVKLKDSPFGVGGYGEFGVIRARENPMAARRLRKYVKVRGELA